MPATAVGVRLSPPLCTRTARLALVAPDALVLAVTAVLTRTLPAAAVCSGGVGGFVLAAAAAGLALRL